jgi:hypothetical protein
MRLSNLISKTEKPIIPKVKGKIDDFQYVESVFVDEKPVFLVKNLKTNSICIVEKFEDERIRPLEKNECGYIPFSFSQEEFDELIKSKILTEELLIEVKNHINTYIQAHENIKILILGNIFITYSQEWISTLHYPYFVGETESGKSTVLHLGKHLNYRCLVSEDIPHANIYNFLGVDEEGTGTICEDESQELGKDREKIRTYKTGYAKGSLKPRVQMFSNSKQQVYYKTFCAKWFAGETVPQDKGFLERLAIIHMIGGKPKENIKRPTISQREELSHLRNKLLIWKLQQLPKHNVNFHTDLKGRDQELWEDFLNVFDNSQFHFQAKQVVGYYVKQRHNSMKNSIEAKIFKILHEHLDNHQIESKLFWIILTDDHPDLPGKLDDYTLKTFYPDEFESKLTPNSLARIIEDKFQGKKHSVTKTVNGKSKKITYYVFDSQVIESFSSKYEIES